ncbi:MULTISPECIES: aldehyde dehydrogenase family protein [unclassified Acidisoma]|jgi:acyl-CoA reductase-like NAD-dependent aldehyde dehydrogenase|uniref:aldehyde dehydrogenase family protein n=1 Tax=unclassified Acidisoma TaxID=2634065 RepID=UPI00131C38E1|nr:MULTISPECIES: aldehyde dehydrogenase family protein [unclassified Acidisoma]
MSATNWHERAAALKPETRFFIGGDLATGSGGHFETINPANGQVIAAVSEGTPADIDRAVADGLKAYRSGSWSRMAPRDRMAVMYRFADLIEQNVELFALLDTLDMGKPISDMVNIDVPASVHCIRFTTECIDKLTGSTTATPSNVLHYINREPLGVVGAIVPWNYPLLMAVWKIAPALAAGNSVVLKPAEQSPLSAVHLARLFAEAGGPSGVFNVVNGPGETVGRALALHNDVAKISFTGSTEVGKLMLQYAGQSNMKKVALECGGKTPQVMMADLPDLATAAKTAAAGIYGNMGEVCNAGSRLLVDRKIHDEFVHSFMRESESWIPGDPLNEETNMGPLVTFEQQKRVLGYVDIGKKGGASLAFGGNVPQGLEKGAYVAPGLFTGVDSGMRIAKEEIFGPIAALIPVDGVENAIEVANDTIYGLAAGIWTSNLTTAHTLAREIEAGTIWVNCFDEGDMTQPFGGYKQSGNARDKCFDTVLAYTQSKSVWVKLV